MVKHVNTTCYVPDPPLIWQLTKCFEYQEAGCCITYMWFANSSEDKSIGIFFPAVYVTPLQANSPPSFPSIKSIFLVLLNQKIFLYRQWFTCEFNRKNTRI